MIRSPSSIRSVVLAGCAMVLTACSDEGKPALTTTWKVAADALRSECADAVDMTNAGKVDSRYSATCALAVKVLDDGFVVGWMKEFDDSRGADNAAIVAIGRATGCWTDAQVERMKLAAPGDALVTDGSVSWGFDEGDDNPATAALRVVCTP